MSKNRMPNKITKFLVTHCRSDLNFAKPFLSAFASAKKEEKNW